MLGAGTIQITSSLRNKNITLPTFCDPVSQLEIDTQHQTLNLRPFLTSSVSFNSLKSTIPITIYLI